jgi:3-phenylpropionate/cinnamic acid dioxygenase small subunit
LQESELQWLSDQLEIRNLIARLAHLADDGELELYATCYSDDISWEAPPGPDGPVPARRGLAAAVDGSRQRRAEGIQGPNSHVRHVVSTTEVRSDGSDRATSRSYWRMYQNGNAEPQVRALGVYDDEFTRTPAGWRMSRRTISPG